MTRERTRAERRDVDLERGEPLAGGAARGGPRALRRAAKPLRDWSSRPRILITNDDGVESRGLLTLRQALEPLGETTVVAPDTNQSAVGHQKTLMRPLRVRERTLINGCPAFAISQEYYEHPDFSLAAIAADIVARNVLEHGLSPGQLINVNVPAVSLAECDGMEVTRLGKRVYQDQLIRRVDPRGIPYFWIGGPPPSGLAEPGTDFHAVVNRRIAVTPIQLDLTARRLLKRMRAWRWELPEPGEAAPVSVRAAGEVVPPEEPTTPREAASVGVRAAGAVEPPPEEPATPREAAGS